MITPRLQSIIDLIDAKTVADIGTDHAYIPIRLARDNKITKAVACDKNKGPIDIARLNVEKYGLSDIIELRQGDGLSPLKKNETEAIIIAGMGGKLIADIIEADIEKIGSSKLILQPMNAQYELRKKLFELGFTIEKEELSAEGFKVYNLMSVVVGEDKREREEFEFHIPSELLSHPLLKMLVDKKRREFTKIMNGQKNSAQQSEDIIIKYKDLLGMIDKLC